MALDYYFINETKKQIVSSKVLDFGFEDKEALLSYLSQCRGDTIRIVDESDEVIDDIWSCDEESEYKYIDLFSFNLSPDRRSCPETERLYKTINNLEE